MSAAKKRGLGRGLDSLIQSAPTAPTGARQLAVGELHPNRDQPRSRFDETGLEELADSIRAQGVIQPIIVTARSAGGYTIVAGERRWRAAQRAELAEVPALVREISGDQELLELALVENLQRSDLNSVEEAEAYQTLQDKFSLSQDELASRVGKARTTVANSLRLLRLPTEVTDLMRDGRLTAGQARPLLALDSREEQCRWAERAVNKSLSARDLERLVRSAKGGRKGRTPKARSIEVHTAAAEETLTQKLQTRVEIRRRGKGGRVLLHFHTEEELIRLYDLLISKGEGP
ncbi:MAG: ParB/RepB/Spo0J family partition protein [Acidobacteriota bacterium]